MPSIRMSRGRRREGGGSEVLRESGHGRCRAFLRFERLGVRGFEARVPFELARNFDGEKVSLMPFRVREFNLFIPRLPT